MRLIFHLIHLHLGEIQLISQRCGWCLRRDVYQEKKVKVLHVLEMLDKHDKLNLEK